MRISAFMGTPREQDDEDDESQGLLLTRLTSLEEDVEEEQPPTAEDPHAAGLGGTLSSATLGIIKGMVGPAILYLPHGFASAGYLVAIPMLLLSTSLFLWSSGCLLDCWKMEMMSKQQQKQQQHRRHHHHHQKITLSYPQLAYRAWGI